MEQAAMTAMRARQAKCAPMAPAAVEQRNLAPPPINAIWRAPAIQHQAHAATQLLPMEQPAMTAMPARQAMHVTMDPVPEHRLSARKVISVLAAPAYPVLLLTAQGIRQVQHVTMVMSAPSTMYVRSKAK
jgi:hypothetical protein